MRHYEDSSADLYAKWRTLCVRKLHINQRVVFGLSCERNTHSFYLRKFKHHTKPEINLCHGLHICHRWLFCPLANTSRRLPPHETAAGSEVITPPRVSQGAHRVPFQVR